MTMKDCISKLAIIPAKRFSERCAGKNIRLFAGIPLFLHSVNYALREGFTPLVSTDSPEIMGMCRSRQIMFFEETVDDSKMENCVSQVLDQIDCDQFAVLQPSSPLRVPGLLRFMSKDMEAGECRSALTTQKIKLIGFLDGEFQVAHREQDAKRFFHFFDGNIFILTKKHFQTNRYFFDNDSKIYINKFPFYLQIDEEEQFGYLECLYRAGGQFMIN